MKVTRGEWEKVNNLIARFGEAEEDLKQWVPKTSSMVFQKKTMLEYIDQFVFDLEVLETAMEFE